MAKNYSYNELMKMQEDAIKRVREMQKRATLATQAENKSSESPKIQTDQTQEKDMQNQTIFRKEKTPQHQSFDTKKQTQQTKQPQQSQICPYNKNRRTYKCNRQAPKNPQQNQEFKNQIDIQKPTNKQHQNINSTNPLFNLFGGGNGLANLFGGNGFNNLFSGGKLDISSIMGKLDNPETGDQILLIALLILLSDEDADKVLMLALLYIMID